MKLKIIAMFLLIFIMITLGFSSDSTQGEELLFFLPEVQLARAWNVFLETPESSLAGIPKFTNIPMSTWINEQGGLRSNEEVFSLLIHTQNELFSSLTCIDETGEVTSPVNNPLIEDLIKGNEIEQCGNLIDGNKEPIRLISMFFILGTYLDDVENVTKSFQEGLEPELILLEKEVCQSLFERVESGSTLELRTISFFILEDIQDRVQQIENDLDASSLENSECFNPVTGTIQELETQANQGNIMAAVGLGSSFFVQAFDSNDPIEQDALRVQITDMMLRSSAGASPLVSLALILPMLVLGIDI